MGILLTELPKTVDICGAKVPIKWDFRTAIQFSEIFASNDIDDVEKIRQGAELYYGDIVHKFTEKEAVEAIKQMLWFYTAGEMPQRSKKRQRQIYSFEQDGDYIYSAFREQFNVDLSTSELHWWQFRAMFSSISNNTQLGKIIGYRSADISKLSTKEEREFYRAMQKEYALNKKVNDADDELIEQINEALMRGEDVSHLLEG